MIKTMLINPIGPDPPPIYFGPHYGTAIMASAMEKMDNEVSCLDFDTETYEEMISSVHKGINEKEPDCIGISCQSTCRGVIYRLIRDIKKNFPNRRIVLGGPFASFAPDIFLEKMGADIVVIGPGEETMNEIIDTLENGGDLSGVKGIAFMKNGKMVRTEKRMADANLDNLPFPAFHLFDVEKKLKEKRGFMHEEIAKRKLRERGGGNSLPHPNSLMLLSSMGCIYSCSFCPMSKSDKPKFRRHSPKYFTDMLEEFAMRYNQRHFVFGDNFFTCIPSRAEEICDEIIRRDLDIEWIAMTRTDYLNRNLVFKMKKAGCSEISFGVESCSPQVQRRTGKMLDMDSVKNAFRWCEEAGIRTVLMLMVGNEGETEETILETLRFIRDIEPDSVLVKITKVYPGTRIHDIAIESGLIPEDYYLKDDEAPPVFTAENDIKSIRRWESMFKLREITFQLQKECNNNCIVCSFRTGKPMKTGEVKNSILNLAERCDTLTLAGGDPLIRNDIFEIIDFCKKIHGIKICLRTNARMASYGRVAKRLAKSGIERVLIPFFSHEERMYENASRTHGSFKQAALGISNLTKAGIEAVAEIPILPENFRELDVVVRFLFSKGVKNFHIYYDPRKITLPTLDDIEPFLDRALGEIERNDGISCVTGIPYCKMKGHEDCVEEIKRPFDEIHEISGQVVNVGKERRSERTQTSICRRCDYHNVCEGFWKEKPVIGGLDEKE